MIGKALQVSVDGVKSVACERCGHDPLVVRFVQMLIDESMMKASMNVVNQTIAEHDEERYLENQICRSVITRVIIEQ